MELTETFAKKKERVLKEKQEAARLVRARHQQEVERIITEANLQKEIKMEKKRQLMRDLQRQAEEARQRKREERERRRQEEAEISKEAKEMEDKVRQREREEAERLQNFFEALNREAELREVKAEWKLRRSGLSEKRRIHLRREAALMERLREGAAVQRELTGGGRLDNKPAVPERWRSVVLDRDEMGNVLVRIEDSEGNIVTDTLGDFARLDDEVRSRLTAGDLTLPPHLERSVVESVRSTEAGGGGKGQGEKGDRVGPEKASGNQRQGREPVGGVDANPCSQSSEARKANRAHGMGSSIAFTDVDSAEREPRRRGSRDDNGNPTFAQGM